MAETESGRVRAWQQATVETIFCSLRDRYLYPRETKTTVVKGACIDWAPEETKLPFVMGYTQTHEGWSRAQKQVLRQRQAYNMYIQQHVNGYTKTHVGWYKVLKQRKKVHRHKQLHMHSEAITYNMYRQQQREGTGYMVKHIYGNIGSPQKTHTPPPRIARRKPLQRKPRRTTQAVHTRDPAATKLGRTEGHVVR